MFKGTPLLSQMICRKAPRRTGARGRAAKEKGRGRAHLGRLSFIDDIFGQSWYRGNYWTIVPEEGREEGASRACAAAR